MARRNYSSTAVRTTLSAPITDVATSLVVADATGYPTTPFTIIVDADTANEEVMTVTVKASTTFTVTRGVEGTSAIAHTAGGTVQHGVSARDFDEPNAFLNTGGTVTGNVVVDGTLDTTGAVDVTGALNTTGSIGVNIQDGSGFAGVNVEQVGGGYGSRLTLNHGRGTTSSRTQSLGTDTIGRISMWGTSDTGAWKEAFRLSSFAFDPVTDTNSNVDTYLQTFGVASWISLISNDTNGTICFEAEGTGSQKLLFKTGPTVTTTVNDAGVFASNYAGATFGSSTAFTPTVSGTGWALGNATHQCEYLRLGDLVHLNMKITWGSTSTFGTGDLRLGGMPNLRSGRQSHGVAQYVDGSTNYMGYVEFWNNNTFDLHTNASPSASVINTRPFTWASGDVIYITMTYEGS